MNRHSIEINRILKNLTLFPVFLPQLGDQQLFDLGKQHDLARLLSFIDAGAIVCAPLSGFLLDSVGFMPTAIITIALGVYQMFFLLIAGSREGIMVASFVAYAVFRAFLFPYFFASLSKKIGFRYFGVLSGLSFSISGLSQLAIAPLASQIEGDCHEFDDIGVEGCSEGDWRMIHVIQIVCLLLLFSIPLLDVKAEKDDETGQGGPTPNSSYGSVEKGDKLAEAEVY